MNPESHYSRKDLLFLGVSSLVTLLYFASAQFGVPDPIDFDVYYHLGVAREMLKSGPLQAFPWTPYSLFAEHYADKEFLFHAILMPFSKMAVLDASRWGAFAGQTFFVVVFAICLWRLRVPSPWMFPLLLSCLGPALAVRFSMCRPHTWGVAFSVLVITLLIGKARLRWLLLAAFIYSLFHTAAWITAFYAGVWMLWSFLIPDGTARRRIEWRPFATVISGWCLGQIVHPNFPETFRLMFLQNFVVPFHSTAAGNAALRVALGGELHVPGVQIISDQWPIYVLLLGMGVMLAERRDIRSPVTFTVFTIALAFTVVSSVFLRRLYEMAAPFGALGMAVVWRDWITSRQVELNRLPDAVVRELPELRARFFGLILILVIAIASWSWSVVSKRIPSKSPPLKMSQWVARNIVEPQPVFTAQWADSASLFYFAPHLTTLVALDPTFFYAKDRDLFIRYVDIVLGKTRNPVSEILDRFKANYITLWKLPAFQTFDRQLATDPRARIIYQDETYRVWKIGRDPVRNLERSGQR